MNKSEYKNVFVFAEQVTRLYTKRFELGNGCRVGDATWIKWGSEACQDDGFAARRSPSNVNLTI